MVRRLIIGITGASGAIYGVRLLEIARTLPEVETHLIVSPAGWLNVDHELERPRHEIEALADVVHAPRNIGASIAQSRTAVPADIDKAVTLGLNYPNGPFRFADTLGVDRIHQVLSSMYRIYGDQRYRPVIWLTRRAKLGVSALTP